MKTKKHKVKINDLSKLGSVLSIKSPTEKGISQEQDAIDLYSKLTSK